MMIAFIAVLVPALLILTPRFGHTGAALACLVAAIVAVPLNLFNVCRCLEIPASSMASILWRPFAGSAVMAAAVSAGLSAFPAATSAPAALVQLLGSMAIGASSYGLAALALWWTSGRPDGAERWLIANMADRLRRRRRA
jgi:O-antigen/teichoic acid export membrane protein